MDLLLSEGHWVVGSLCLIASCLMTAWAFRTLFEKTKCACGKEAETAVAEWLLGASCSEAPPVRAEVPAEVLDCLMRSVAPQGRMRMQKQVLLLLFLAITFLWAALHPEWLLQTVDLYVSGALRYLLFIILLVQILMLVVSVQIVQKRALYFVKGFRERESIVAKSSVVLAHLAFMLLVTFLIVGAVLVCLVPGLIMVPLALFGLSISTEELFRSLILDTMLHEWNSLKLLTTTFLDSTLLMKSVAPGILPFGVVAYTVFIYTALPWLYLLNGKAIQLLLGIAKGRSKDYLGSRVEERPFDVMGFSAIVIVTGLYAGIWLVAFL